MARRRGNNNSTGSCIIYMFMIGFITSVAGAIASFIAKNGTIVIFLFIAIFAIMFYIAKKHEKMQKDLLEEQKLYEEANNNDANLVTGNIKLVNEKDMWSIRIDSNFRIEFIALDINEDLRLIENIKIMEVSKHYG